MRFYIVDAFSDIIFSGNPAGVVILDKGSVFPDNEVMRKTAAELRYSETAFIRQVSKNEFNIRYFTPAAEVDLCGHATIGSFIALMSEGIINSGESYINDTLAGRLNIEIHDGLIMMDMSEPKFIGSIEDQASLEELYNIMGLEYTEFFLPSDITKGSKGTKAANTLKLLPELISTGLPDIMLPVKSKYDLEKINPDFQALSNLSERYNVTGVHAFVPGDQEITAYCRNFAPLYEIDEESATGTSNGALTYYLYKKGMIREGNINTFLQGEAMGRPSKIFSKLQLNEETIKIQVGGNGKVLARGELFI